jgi:serine/threonine protein phosphatase PrpC
LMVKELEVKAVPKLIALANERGGDDNITVVVVKVKVSRK